MKRLAFITLMLTGLLSPIPVAADVARGPCGDVERAPVQQRDPTQQRDAAQVAREAMSAQVAAVMIAAASPGQDCSETVRPVEVEEDAPEDSEEDDDE